MAGLRNLEPEDSGEEFKRGLDEALDRSSELVRLFRTGSLDVDGVLKRISEAKPGDEILMTQKDGGSLLCQFSIFGCYEVIQKLWERGLRPSVSTHGKCTLLHGALRTYPLGTTNTKDHERAKIIRLYLTSENHEKTVPVDHSNDFGWRALEMAVRLKLEECVEVLLGHGADVHLAGKGGNYPIHDAVGQPSILKMVVKADPKAINLQNKEGNTALLLALKRGDLVSCQVLLEGEADTNIANNEGATPLFLAAKLGQGDLVRALVKHGSLVNTPAGEQGITPLHWAAFKEMKDIALYLIENGGDVLAKDKIGRTPLSMATSELAQKMREVSKCTGCHSPCTMTPEKKAVDAVCCGDLQALIHSGVDPNYASGDTHASLVHMAAYYGHLHMLMFLIHRGADLTAVDKDGDNILHFVSMKQFPEGNHDHALRMLLLTNKKLGLNQQNHSGDTPLMTALKHGFPERAKVFILGKAAVSIANNNGELPLHRAAQDLHHLEVLFHLAERSSNFDPRDKQGLTPLMRAVRARCSPAVKYLLQRGANPNLRDGQGNTPLITSVQERDFSITELLLVGGADPCATTTEGKVTPMHIAIRGQDLPMVKLLWIYGADVAAKDNQGLTPVDSAPPMLRERLRLIMEIRNDVSSQMSREGVSMGTTGCGASSPPTQDNETPPTCSHGQSTQAMPTSSEATPTCPEATPTCPEATPSDAMGPCNDMIWKLAATNRPLAEKLAPPFPVPSSSEAPPTFSTGFTDKNQRESRGQSPNVTHEVKERREEDTGQLADNQEDGPLSNETYASLKTELADVTAQMAHLHKELERLSSANKELTCENKTLQRSLRVQENAVISENIHHAMAVTVHVLTHGMFGAKKKMRRNTSQDLQDSTTNGGGGHGEREIPRRLTHESSRDSIDKSPDLPRHNNAVDLACDSSVCPLKGSDCIAEGYQKYNPLKNGCLQWWMIEKSDIKVNDASLNNAPPPATPCSGGPECQFFEVSRGSFRNVDVVVRTIKSVPTWDYDTYTTFFKEANFLSCLHCPYLVQYLGACFDPASQTCSIVNEYMSRGSLYSVLHEDKLPLEWNTRTKMMLDVSRGMAFLHSYNVLHRNLTPRNILIGEHFNAKINDFDLHETKVKCGFQEKCPIPPVYCAPEARETLQFTPQTDVYSFGVILYECGTGKKMFAELQSNAVALVMRIMMGSRPPFPPKVPTRYKGVAERCWSQEPNLRPSFEAVVAELATVTSA